MLRGDPPAHSARREQDTVAVELETITPVIGGGIEPFEPDRVDGVRVPGIRGVLRWWWRSLYAVPSDKRATTLEREARLWGGVAGQDEAGQDESKSLAGCVRARVELLSPGREFAAGVHEVVNGRFRSLPRWSLARDLAYGLFPLQQPQEERAKREADARAGKPLPTRPVREGLRFRLTLVVDPRRFAAATQRPGNAGEERDPLREVLGSLWGWLWFGGIGGRTRRGFGALALSGSDALHLPGVAAAEDWRVAFAGPRGDSPTDWQAWLERVRQIVGPKENGRLWPPRLLLGPLARSSREAHEEAVRRLAEFRQGRGVGRDPGDQRPGESRWPEAHLLRALRRQEGAGRFEHFPPDGAERRGVPRAAFGLPLQIQFKDRGDSQANSRIVPVGGKGRRASPVILRPVPAGGGGPSSSYRPAVLLLRVDPPECVEIQLYSSTAENPPTRPVREAAGAKAPIERYLAQAGGDAVKAFAAWLHREHRYLEVGPPQPGARDRA